MPVMASHRMRLSRPFRVTAMSSFPSSRTRPTLNGCSRSPAPLWSQPGEDGTVALVARAIARHRVPMAILPLGTANNGRLHVDDDIYGSEPGVRVALELEGVALEILV